MFERADWGGTLEISSTYHHVHMHHWQHSLLYSGFAWEGQLCRCLVLPFCLSTAPRIFTTVRARSHNARAYPSPSFLSPTFHPPTPGWGMEEVIGPSACAPPNQ